MQVRRAASSTTPLLASSSSSSSPVAAPLLAASYSPPVSTASFLDSSFLHFCDAGLWYISIFNDDEENRIVAFRSSTLGKWLRRDSTSWSSTWPCVSVPSYVHSMHTICRKAHVSQMGSYHHSALKWKDAISADASLSIGGFSLLISTLRGIFKYKVYKIWSLFCLQLRTDYELDTD